MSSPGAATQSPTAATPSPSTAPTTAATTNCPATFVLESTNGRDYVVVFDANLPTVASFRVETYTRTAAYAFTLANVAIDKKTAMPERPYQSVPTLFTNPDTQPLLGAIVRSTRPSGAPCPDRDVQIPSVASLTSPDRIVTPQFAATQREVVREVRTLPTLVVPEPISSEAFTCDMPFAQASPIKLARPSYPQSAVDEGAVGTVRIKVSLAANGAVTNTGVYSTSGNAALDAAALDAARRTTYNPEVFECKPLTGDYLFTADFRQSSRRY